MRVDAATLTDALRRVSTVALNGLLVRVVPDLDLWRTPPPNFLLTAGRPGRFNPAGVACVYFSQDDRTAAAEYRRQWQGTSGEHQPRATYFCRIRLRYVLDLTDASSLAALGLPKADLHQRWRMARTPLRSQVLGGVVAEQHRISAIRFASDAARAEGFEGANVVMFRDAVRRPDSVRVQGPEGKALQSWPARRAP